MTGRPATGDDPKTSPNNDKTAPITSEGQSPTQTAYTTLSRSRLRQLQLLLGLATITSPLTATMYFPLLPLLREHFDTSAQAINLTLTLYIVFQAISPVLFGPLSDSYGRRPCFLLSLALYVVGNIGLAVNQRSYAVLLVFRAVQSLGASAAYAISFGVVADVCLTSERGRMLGPISMALNLGACVGPVVGGLVAYTSGSYLWVFWTLVIVGVMLFCGVGLLLPETARGLVGNGSDTSRYKWWQLSWLTLARRRLVRTLSSKGETTQSVSAPEMPEIAVPAYGLTKLLACFRIIFYKDSSLALWVHGSFYTVDYSFVAAVPDIYKDIYLYNELQMGLAYLPYCTGKLMDANYRAVARAAGWTVDRVAGDDLLRFPVERARTRGSLTLLAISTVTMVGYGWAVQRGAPAAVPLALQFVQGFWGTAFYTTYSALLVDGFPDSPSTAAAATSITRCAMAAAGVALLQPLLAAAGRGWYFTTLGLWSGGFGAAAVALLQWRGMEWRRVRSGLAPQ
ncbi:major facilitator superfamily domain-containing protein [Diplogelasinospora grovesii]|uniref:Major facilitator superfamily domain-containing protein n=1 Tax=Diplogelasinospora grovesii TaxID=303347 RepID=A0AAN6MZ72_9PEZI|nr:major facilitator superfamily domain-containing protein [Diplogelasinospora grovesii]